MRAADDKAAVPCPIPGDNFSALQDAGRIPDPYWRENEAKVQWVAERDWIFSRAFDVPAALLRHRAVYLSFDSIDTVAEVFVNGRLAGRADNQFRRWRFEVRRLLREGANELEVRIASPVRAAREAHAALAPDFDPGLVNGSSVPGIFALRKCPCSGGWDWGISLPSSGLHGGVWLVGADAALLDSAWCDTAFLRGGACLLFRGCPLPVQGLRDKRGTERRQVRGRDGDAHLRIAGRHLCDIHVFHCTGVFLIRPRSASLRRRLPCDGAAVGAGRKPGPFRQDKDCHLC